MKNELRFYDDIKDWDFSMIEYTEENLTDWNLYKLLNDCASPKCKILDLGTGGGEKVLKNFPIVKEIIATDFSKEMINTANENLAKTERKDITFKQMDNLNMTTPNNYFDIVVARHTCIDANGIYKTLKIGGKLLLRGVDKLDCWQLKKLYGKGQAFKDDKPISLIDYEAILDAGFKKVELVPIHIREYYKTKEDLLALLLKTPILSNFSESEIEENKYDDNDEINMNLLDKYIEENTSKKGILLIRRYYGITAVK
ncbi:MAG: methyltransferase domain-containing protein [Clostridia bacterium]|nr:methyltransferase domain-containing protein [Clostridia bacterium]